jgi:hypothetical protein
MEALNASDPSRRAYELARALRDEGMDQVAMYRLFSEQQDALSGDDPRYDAVVDTMDLIWGGAWAKGRRLFEQELTEDRLARE